MLVDVKSNTNKISTRIIKRDINTVLLKMHFGKNFMGYKFYRNRTTLRKTILKKIRAKAVRIWRKAKATIFDSKQMVSALAWIKNCDMYNYYREYIKPFIDFGKMKHKISTADRKVRYIEHDRIQARRKYAIGQTA